MKRLLIPLLCLLAAGASARQESPAPAGWWNENPAYAMPIRAVGIEGRRPLKEIGVQQTRLDTTRLHENIAQSMADVLTFNSSLFVKQYGRATLSTVAFRGTSASHTQVTWNGMRINSPMLGMTDFSMIPAMFIDDASLLHGTSSVIVAGGGLGGAVTLSTRPVAEQGFALRFVQGVGSFATSDSFLRLTYGGKRWQSSTRVVYASSDNDFKYTNYAKKRIVYDDQYRIVDSYYPVERNKNGAYDDLHLLQELYFTPANGDRFSLKAWYIHSKRGLPMLSSDQKEQADYSNVQRERTLRSVLAWSRLRSDWKVEARAGYIHTWMGYDYDRALGNGAMKKMVRSRSRVDTFFGSAEAEYTLGENWLFSAGVSAHQHLVRSEDRNVTPAKDPQQGSAASATQQVQVAYDQQRLELSGYASARYRPTARLGLSLALREEAFGGEWTPPIPAFFADYLLSERGQVVLKASVSRNFRFPTLNDLYFLPGGNPELKRELGFTYDAGVSFAAGRDGEWSLHGQATWFDSRIDDWIVWVPTFKGFWTPKNLKRVHAYGVELKAGLDVRLARHWQAGFDGGFSWTPSINRGDPTDAYDQSVGKQLVYIPEYASSLSARLCYRSWRLIYKWCYYSERYTTSDNDLWSKLGRVRPYFMNDVSLEKAFALRWADLSLKGAVNNLFNEEYESVLSRPMPRLNVEFFLDIRPKWGHRR